MVGVLYFVWLDSDASAGWAADQSQGSGLYKGRETQMKQVQ